MVKVISHRFSISKESLQVYLKLRSVLKLLTTLQILARFTVFKLSVRIYQFPWLKK